MAGAVEQVCERVAHREPMRTIRASLADLAPGRRSMALPSSDAVPPRRGLFHGGIIGAIADTAGGQRPSAPDRGAGRFWIIMCGYAYPASMVRLRRRSAKQSRACRRRVTPAGRITEYSAARAMRLG